MPQGPSEADGDYDLGRFFRRWAALRACDQVRRKTLGGPLVPACAATE